MGNSTSIITPERFQEQIFSIVLYHLCPKANPGMRFVPDYDWDGANRRQSRETMINSLPVPETLTYDALIDYYQTREPRVRQYLESQVLNSEENLTRFYRILIDHLSANSHLSHPQPRKTLSKSNSRSRQASKKPSTNQSQSAGGPNYPKPQRLTRSHLNEMESHEPSLISNLESYANNSTNLDNFTKCHVVDSRQSSKKKASRTPTASDGDETVPLPEVKRQLLEAYREGKLERGEDLTEGDFDYTEAPHRRVEQSAGATTNNSHKASHRYEESSKFNNKSLSENTSEGLPERIYDHSEKRSRSRSRRSSRNNKSASDLQSDDSPKIAPPSNYAQSHNDPNFQDEPSQSSLLPSTYSRQSSRSSRRNIPRKSRNKDTTESDADTMRYNKRFGEECAIED